MERRVTVAEFRRAIERLPASDAWVEPGVWYTTQKQHWLGWLRDYNGPGYYGRIPGQNRDAKYAYNHIVCPGMLLWLMEAAGVEEDLIAKARDAHDAGTRLPQQCGGIRRHVPWSVIYEALFC
jgi:hypothetical protein